ncbi:MAG TPA: M23 family metallopeptidase [Pyrinomonadaceae bacterium]|nr:M23 family metallopeptidase [Pyrinomonadaceae bacterium]
MKTLLILIVVILAFFAIVNNLPTASVEIERAKEKATASFRYAELLAKEPEAKINVPVRSVKTKQIADTFGAPRGNDREHQGQDIFAPRNTPVYSATNGYVWRIGENKLGGNTVWVVGAGGRVYYYAHLEKYADNLKVSDAVTTDTIIGYVGTSGNAQGTPPHLHFGVYTQSGAVNPLPLLSD